MRRSDAVSEFRGISNQLPRSTRPDEEIRNAQLFVADWALRMAPEDPEGTCRELLDLLGIGKRT